MQAPSACRESSFGSRNSSASITPLNPSLSTAHRLPRYTTNSVARSLGNRIIDFLTVKTTGLIQTPLLLQPFTPHQFIPEPLVTPLLKLLDISNKTSLTFQDRSQSDGSLIFFPIIKAIITGDHNATMTLNAPLKNIHLPSLKPLDNHSPLLALIRLTITFDPILLAHLELYRTFTLTHVDIGREPDEALLILSEIFNLNTDHTQFTLLQCSYYTSACTKWAQDQASTFELPLSTCLSLFFSVLNPVNVDFTTVRDHVTISPYKPKPTPYTDNPAPSCITKSTGWEKAHMDLFQNTLHTTHVL